jgi:hypothetical protein
MLKELPENWCIKDCAEVSLYASIKFPPCSNVVGKNYLHINSNNEGIMQYNFYRYPHDGYKEITLNEFKILVLGIKKSQDIKTRINNLKI